MTAYDDLHEPAYVLEEARLRANLRLISDVARRADVEVILAFKAYALWKTFGIFREYIRSTTASSLYEARMGRELFGAPVHTFSPAYTDADIDDIARCSSHLVFNSLSQHERYQERVRRVNGDISLGLRLNPEYSEVTTDLYNPCAAGSRLGITIDKLCDTLPAGIDGLHFHFLCESGADVFERSLAHIEHTFSKYFPQVKWINFGGGHLMTRRDYDTDRFVDVMQGFHNRYPWLKVIVEPGSAFAWQTGPLVAQVVDVVEERGVKTAIVNVSFTCHMPDCLEMPYMPAIRGAETGHAPQAAHADSPFVYRIGGNSCLAGDYMGPWRFDHELSVGENIIFEDMMHYTTVKTCMFNGIAHPAIMMLHEDGHLETLRRFAYEDYINRMD